MAQKHLVSIDLNKNELQNSVIQPLGADPGSPVTGQLYFNSGTKKLRTWNGATWDEYGTSTASGTVTGISIASTNGLAGTSDGNTATPTLTLSTTVTGMIKGNGTALSAATAGTDFLKGDVLSVGKIITAAAAAGGASLLITPQTGTPSSPASGDLWNNAGVLKFYNGAATKDIAFVDSTLTGTWNGAVIGSTYGGAGAVSGILKANGSGTVSAATAGTDYLTDSSTNTLTNKTFDANGAGNSITNIEVADLAGSAVITAAEGIGSNNVDTALPTAAAVKAYADSLFGSNDAMVFKGAIDASTNPNYPAADAGHTYKISVAGKIGGASGPSVQVGDTIYCTADATSAGDHATVGSSWVIIQNNLEAASTSVAGYVQLATQAEAQAKTDTAKALTAASVADFARKYTGLIGNGAATSIAVTHGLGSQYVTAQVFDASTGEMVVCDITLTSSTQTTFTFATAPASNAYRVVITG